uniref:Uncharacterized protein n=1 Tax=Oryza brachyantha TaxID=4533 RepID=J3KTX4_ORYBR
MVTFTARRSEPELVAPARPTPRETKALSDLDDQWTLRYYETVVGFFRVSPRMAGGLSWAGGNNVAAMVIRAAVAEALVYYYPVAGRLRALRPGGNKLAVDCTAEGVVFVEADADVRLEEFGQPLLPPYPCVEELLCDAGDTKAVVGKPLLLMQVTQLKCGGFVIGLHMCHCIFDAFGLLQFIKTIAGFAGGEPVPSTMPVWGRDHQLFTARTPPSVAHVYPAYKPILDGLDRTGDDVMLTTPPESMVMRYFRFGPEEISLLRGLIPPHLVRSTTSFELLTAVMWRCRTVALGYEPHHRVRLTFTLNLRGRLSSRDGAGGAAVRRGYYGNAHFSPMAVATVGELTRRPLADTVELMSRAKGSTTSECMASMVDLLASWREQPAFPVDRTYEVSDTKWAAGGGALRCGVAEMVGGGTPFAGDLTSKLISYHMQCKDENGEDMTVVSMLLPEPAMERFTKEMSFWLKSY